MASSSYWINEMNTLECRLKAALHKIADFESGDAYVQLLKSKNEIVSHYLKEIRNLERALAEARIETVKVRDMWFETFEEIEKEHEKAIGSLQKKLDQMEKRALAAEAARDKALDDLTAAHRKYYEIATELEDEKGRNLKLHAQINRDYENSSIPSSRSVNHKKISNSREKSGRKPGGQPGHPHHARKMQTPTEVVHLDPPEEILTDTDFKPTGKEIVKQLVNIHMVIDVKEYHADVYYNSKTGEHAHAAFPEGVVDDVNYGGSVKGFLYLLNNDCCTSIDKCRRFLSDLTSDRLNISKGMINKLSRTFAEKSDAEFKKTFADLLLTPVLHTDCTNARVNGNSAFVFICAEPDGKALYFARENKGHKGVKGTVVEDYQGILVHDHEATFYSYGSDHQECSAHVLRYLKDSIDNEPNLTWNKQMRELIQEMVHYRNTLDDSTEPDEEAVKEYERRYDEVLETAEKEYEYEPPSPYYRDGFNLYKRLKKYKDYHLLFFHDLRVPTTNNVAERFLRAYKRKQAQAVSFRSFESIAYLCKGMSMLHELRLEGEENIFERVSKIFE